MKQKTLGHFLLPALLAAGSAQAATIIKANNTTDLFNAASWVGAPAVAPGSADIATWDNTITAANTSNLGTSTTWLGLKISNPTGNVGISISSGKALSVGTSGIDMSTATSDLTISGAGTLRPTASSTSSFNVQTGRTLTIDSTFASTSGTTTVNFNGAGIVNINKLASSTTLVLINNGTGTVNYGGSTTSSLFKIDSTGAGASVVVNGPTLTVSQAASIGSSSNASKLELQSGGINYNAGVTLGNTDGSMLKVSGGAFSTTNVSIGRTSNLGQADAPLTSGFVVTGGTASLSGNLTIGTSNSSATARVAGGALTITGTATVGNTTNTRWSTFQVSSGTLDVNGTNGVQLSTNTATANNSQLLLTGGTTNVQAIKYGAAASLAGSRGDVIVNNGASLYVGSGGVSVVSGNAYTANFSVTDATLGAKANWSSSVPVALSGNVTIKAANAANAAFDITLNGQLSGAGANLIKTGAGTLTLGNAANNFGGSLTINDGTLTLGAAGVAPDAAPVVLAGGSINLNGFNETFGSLTVSSPSTINFGSQQIVFADSSANIWAGSLSFAGTLVTNSIRFGSGPGALTSAQLSNITVNSLSGWGLDSDGYLVVSSIPEASTFVAWAGLAGLVLAGARRRRIA